MAEIGLPLILLAAVWGAFSPILKAIEMMNERRDKIIDPESKLTISHRNLILYSDWLAIFVATYVFAGFIGSLIIIAPQFVVIKQAELRTKAEHTFDIVGAIFLLTATIGLATGVCDFMALRKHIRRLQSSACDHSTASPPHQTLQQQIEPAMPDSRRSQPTEGDTDAGEAAVHDADQGSVAEADRAADVNAIEQRRESERKAPDSRPEPPKSEDQGELRGCTSGFW